MAIALYKDANHPHELKTGGNAGLFFYKFFNQYESDFSKVKEPKKEEKPSPKHKFLKLFTELSDNGTAITNAALRQIKLIENLGGVWFVASNHSASPFVTGTGNSHPVENGFLWHHTLSVPYMQGSAVKGIMRSWLENELGYGASDSDNIDKDKEDLVKYFGSDHKDPKLQTHEQQSGNIIFFDAIPIAQPRLKVEIMTPHMGDYYSDKGKTAPADWHSPNPIPLLAVESISLLFCIAPRNGKIDAGELADLKTALQKALAHMGAGAKTHTGFGRLNLDTDKTEKLKTTQQEKAQQEAFNNATEEEKITTQAANIIQHCKTAKIALESYSEYQNFLSLVKQTEQWQDAYLFDFWQRVVQTYAELKFPQPIDKNKRKDFARDFRKKYPWLKAPQS